MMASCHVAHASIDFKAVSYRLVLPSPVHSWKAEAEYGENYFAAQNIKLSKTSQMVKDLFWEDGNPREKQ